MLSKKKDDMMGNRKETNSTKNTQPFVQNNDIEFLSKKRLKFLMINRRMKFDKR